MSSAEDWHTATDPKSGREYYFNVKTQVSQWDKPDALLSEAEFNKIEEERHLRAEFFRDMEENILAKMADRRKIRSQSPTRDNRPRRTHSFIDHLDGFEGFADKAESKSDNSNDGVGHKDSYDNELDDIDSPPMMLGGRQRTISTIDTEILSFLRSHEPKESKDELHCISPRKSVGIRMHPKDNHSDDMLHNIDAAGYDFLQEINELSIKRNVKASGLRPPHLQRRNSTNTIRITSTMAMQDDDATVQCVAVVIRSHMVEASKEMRYSPEEYDIFIDHAYRNENQRTDLVRTNSISDSIRTRSPFQDAKFLNDEFMERDREENNKSPNNAPPSNKTLKLPSVQEVEEFFNRIFRKSQLESECIIMSLIYCERLIKETQGRLHIRYDNWKSILFACLVMASKVWDDLSMWNVDFSNICTSFDLERINTLELAVLDILNYRIVVPASEYAKYYFHLRSLMYRLGLKKIDDNGTLNLASAKKLQVASEKLESNGGFSPTSSNGGRARAASSVDPSADVKSDKASFTQSFKRYESAGSPRSISSDGGALGPGKDARFMGAPSFGYSLDQIIGQHAHTDADGTNVKGPQRAEAKSDAAGSDIERKGFK